jgi:hypothetical protein
MSLIVCIGFSFGRNLRSFAATCSSDGTRSTSIAETAANCTPLIIVLEVQRGKRLLNQQERLLRSKDIQNGIEASGYRADCSWWHEKTRDEMQRPEDSGNRYHRL